MSLSQEDSDIIRLIMRSPDRGDGWRSVSKMCWPLLARVKQRELLEIDEEGMRVRLSADGKVVGKYAL